VTIQATPIRRVKKPSGPVESSSSKCLEEAAALWRRLFQAGIAVFPVASGSHPGVGSFPGAALRAIRSE